jgi:hypothetical protein
MKAYQLDCDDEDTRYQSYLEFYNANTLQQFLFLYAKFYSNQICTPFYFGSFVNSEEGDNPQATFELGQKFKQITYKGVLVVNSQVTMPYQQKAYIISYVPINMAIPLVSELNRYNGIIAFFYNLNEQQRGARGLYVTYDNDENLNEMFNFTTGEPYSHVGSVDKTALIYIQKWLNPAMKKIINDKTYYQLTIIDANYNSQETHLVDVLLDVLNYIQI